MSVFSFLRTSVINAILLPCVIFAVPIIVTIRLIGRNVFICLVLISLIALIGL